MGKKALIVFLVTSLFVASGLINGSVGLAHGPDDPPPPGNLEPLTDLIERGDISIKLTTVAEGLIAPNWGTSAPGNDERLFVTDQDGILWAIDLTTGAKTVFLDVSDRLVDLGIAGPGTFDERGLLGVAFHPDYATNGLLYTYTSEPVDGDADFSTIPEGETANHQTLIIEWHVPDPTDPVSVVDSTSDRELLRIDQPQFNHDGGAINFGSDGMLYISLGDGGGADDQGIGHVEGGNGQDPSNVLGAILRIDPDGSNSANEQYGIPDNNPFVDKEGFVEEIFAFGFRNPFRFSFDSKTGDLYVGDVGQNDIEEVDVVVAGGNYGWNLKEGSFFFDPDGTGPTCNLAPRGCATEEDPGDLPTDLIDPVAEYDTHTDGHSVIGGFVYRGAEVEELVGRYVFGDFAKTINFAEGTFTDGRLFFLEERDHDQDGDGDGDGDGAGNEDDNAQILKSEILEINLVGQDTLGLAILGFGQDSRGELYVMANETGVPFGAGDDLDEPTGVVLRIDPDPAEGALEFEADLDGDQEVPAVVTDTTGEAEVEFDDALTQVEFELEVENGKKVTQSHIHLGECGENGPVVAFLFKSANFPDGIDVDGDLAEDTLTASDLIGPLAGKQISDLAQEIQSGNAYVNVHTEANPPGEVRGQLSGDEDADCPADEGGEE